MTRVCICPNCKILMTYSSDVQSCPECNYALDGKFTGIANEYKITLEGSSAYAQDVRLLKSTPFEKLKVSKLEVQRAINWILAGLVMAPLLMLFGSWVIGRFIGPGVLIFGYGAFFAGPVAFMLCVSTGLEIILGEPRGKTPVQAFQKIWRDTLFDSGAANMTNPYADSKKTGYLYRRFLRSIHPLHRNVSEQAVTVYINGLRKIARTYFDEIESAMDLSCKNSKKSDFAGQWVNYYHIDSSGKVVSEDSGTALVEGRISIHFDKTCKVSDRETYTLPAAVVTIKINQRYVQCGEFWAPLDPLPAVN